MIEDNWDVMLNILYEDLMIGFGDLKVEMRIGFGDLKVEMRIGFVDLKGEMRIGFVDLKVEMCIGFADLKTTLVIGFRSLPIRESSEEMVRFLREGNWLQDERFTQFDLRIREYHFET